MGDLELGENQGIVLIGGTGNIGREAAGMLGESGNKVIALLSSQQALVREEGIPENILEQIKNVPNDEKQGSTLANSILGKEGSESGKSLDAVISFLQDEGIKPVIMDFTAADIPHKDLIESGFLLGTANKVPSSTMSYRDFQATVGNTYAGNATVMAGQGIVNDTEKAANYGEKIESVEGVFSGTLGFIMAELRNGSKLSQAIKKAIDRGYTEPNPMDDLDGMDVVKKLVILARHAGVDVGINDVDVEGLLDKSYRRFFPDGWDKKGETKEEQDKNKTESIEAFLAEVAKKEDEKFSEKMEKANGKGNTFGYVASFINNKEGPVLNVGTKEVSKESDIAQLKGTDNIAILKTNKGERSPIIGAGAGIHITAKNTIEDIARILRLQKQFNNCK